MARVKIPAPVVGRARRRQLMEEAAALAIADGEASIGIEHFVAGTYFELDPDFELYVGGRISQWDIADYDSNYHAVERALHNEVGMHLALTAGKLLRKQLAKKKYVPKVQL